MNYPQPQPLQCQHCGQRQKHSNDNIDKVRLDLRLLVCKDFGVTDPRNRLDLDIEHWISLVGRTTLNIVVIMIPDQLRADLHGHSLSAAARWSVQRQTTVLYQASQENVCM